MCSRTFLLQAIGPCAILLASRPAGRVPRTDHWQGKRRAWTFATIAGDARISRGDNQGGAEAIISLTLLEANEVDGKRNNVGWVLFTESAALASSPTGARVPRPHPCQHAVTPRVSSSRTGCSHSSEHSPICASSSRSREHGVSCWSPPETSTARHVLIFDHPSRGPPPATRAKYPRMPLGNWESGRDGLCCCMT